MGTTPVVEDGSAEPWRPRACPRSSAMRTTLALLVLVGCQTGVSTQQQASGESAPIVAAKVVPPTTAAVTPMAIAAEAPPTASDAQAPFSLTASDGSGLALRRIDAKAVVEGPLAYTELHLYFHNPEDR